MTINIEKYIKAIRQLKINKSINNIPKELYEEKNLMPLTSIIDIMNDLNSIIEKYENKKLKSIQNYIDFMKNEKGVRFSEKKFDYLFFDSHQILETNDNIIIENNRKGKKLNYSYFNKLSGFVMVQRNLNWDDNKITEFFFNLKSQNKIIN